MKMEQTESSETLAFKIQTPVNHSKESIQHSEEAKVTNQELLKYIIFDV
jgi:hypothetical protein